MMNPVRRQFVLATNALAPFLKAASRNPPCHVGGTPITRCSHRLWAAAAASPRVTRGRGRARLLGDGMGDVESCFVQRPGQLRPSWDRHSRERFLLWAGLPPDRPMASALPRLPVWRAPDAHLERRASRFGRLALLDDFTAIDSICGSAERR
jgi:hypothetical protein